MNQKINDYVKEYRMILNQKSEHVTKNSHYELLLIALIFAITGLLIGYFTNLLTNLSYVTNMLVVTVLGSIILYRYSREVTLQHNHKVKYNTHLAVWPKLLYDITLIIGAMLAIDIILLSTEISLITILFYLIFFVILLFINSIISPIQSITKSRISFVSLFTFALFFLVMFYLTVRLLPIKDPATSSLITGLLVLIYAYIRFLAHLKIHQIYQQKYLYASIYSVLLFLVMVFVLNSPSNEKDDIKQLFSYDYDYESLYTGEVLSIESSGSRVMIVTEENEVIIFDNELIELNRFRIEDIESQTFHLYQVADQFYLGMSSVDQLHYYDTFYQIDEESGLSKIDTQEWTVDSFIYNDQTIISPYYRATYLNELGIEESLFSFLEDNPRFMIEDTVALFYSEENEGSIIYTNNAEPRQGDRYYDDGFVLNAEYDYENFEYNVDLCDIDEVINNTYRNCMVLDDENVDIDFSNLIHFQHIEDHFYFVTSYLSKGVQVARVTVLDRNGDQVYSNVLDVENFEVYSDFFVKKIGNELLITSVNSDLNTSIKSIPPSLKVEVVVILSLLLLCGFPMTKQSQ